MSAIYRALDGIARCYADGDEDALIHYVRIEPQVEGGAVVRYVIAEHTLCTAPVGPPVDDAARRVCRSCDRLYPLWRQPGEVVAP